jgi:Transposase IS116/IS110/IS902 family
VNHEQVARAARTDYEDLWGFGFRIEVDDSDRPRVGMGDVVVMDFVSRSRCVYSHHIIAAQISTPWFTLRRGTARFFARGSVASFAGTAPLSVSSGDHNRHRLSRAENRQLNSASHVAAITQARNATPGRAYYRRKRDEGKSPREALRCLKRRITDAIWRQLRSDLAKNDTTRAAPITSNVLSSESRPIVEPGSGRGHSKASALR